MYRTNLINRYLPPRDVPSAVDHPTVFLAGPITGAPDWQQEATTYLGRWATINQKELNVANPRRPEWHPDGFAAQVAWETRHLRIAAANGCILFWLAKEAESHPERAYGQTTRFELGEWLVRCPERVIIGAEEGFSGVHYLQHRLNQDMLPNCQIYTTLWDTCTAAYRLATR